MNNTASIKDSRIDLVAGIRYLQIEVICTVEQINPMVYRFNQEGHYKKRKQPVLFIFLAVDAFQLLTDQF